MTRVTRRVLIPVIVVGALVGAGTRILDAAQLREVPQALCPAWISRAHQPPADVLILGSSRSSAGIDTHLLGALLAAADSSGDSPAPTVEKLLLTRGAELDRDLMYRTYVQSHGAPRVLVLEVSFERRSAVLAAGGSELDPSPRTLAVFHTDRYSALLRSLRSGGTVGLADGLVRSSPMSVARFALERLEAGVGLALRSPLVALDPPTTCTTSWKLEVDGRSRPYRAGEQLVDSATRDRWRRMNAKSIDVDFTSTYSSEELALIADILDQAGRDGVERVIVTYFPGYSARPTALDKGELAGRLPLAGLFDVRDLFADDRYPDLAEHFRDAAHLDRMAAHVVTTVLAEYVLGHDSD